MNYIDFNNLKQELTQLGDKLNDICSNVRNNNSYAEFLIDERDTLAYAYKYVSTALNTANNLGKKKRKLDQIDEKLNSVIKKKKIQEKVLVLNQIKDTSVTNKTKQITPSHESNKDQAIDLSDSCQSSRCYACNIRFTKVHFFYDQLCFECGEFNYLKRNMKCDFTGKIALVTGCRIKIGYEICLYLLRNNCQVIGTTRFVKDAYLRFSKEADFKKFKHNLKLYPLDLRDLNGIKIFIEYLYKTLPKLDIIINNAAQTLRRSVQFYKNLIETEIRPLESFQDEQIHEIIPDDNRNLWTRVSSNCLKGQSDSVDSKLDNNQVSLSFIQSQIPIINEDFMTQNEKYPVNVLDKDFQQVELSNSNSWKLEIDQINMFEFAETQIINSWSPFYLCSNLLGLMKKGDYEARFIINVSSMEGKFNRAYKSTQHCHTNMSKAALNMLTRTCGSYFAKYNIFMNSVDTGWVSEMNPDIIYKLNRTVPLDEIDGAMRVLDPIVKGYKERQYEHSKFYKNYLPTSW